MKERWKPVPGLEKYIAASDMGRIKRLERTCMARTGISQTRPEKLYQPFCHANGYLVIALKIGAVRKKYCVHRLVALAFVSGYFDGAHVDHIDGNKTNNIPSNLEWVTENENTRRQWANGLVNIRGEKHPSSKLTNNQVAKIKHMLSCGVAVRKIANRFKVGESLIYKIRQGKKRIHG